jgi:hypothetical protein
VDVIQVGAVVEGEGVEEEEVVVAEDVEEAGEADFHQEAETIVAVAGCLHMVGAVIITETILSIRLPDMLYVRIYLWTAKI